MKTLLKLFLLSVVLTFTVSALAQSEDDPILVGITAPMTGPQAVHGTMFSHATEIAAAEINKNGGVLGRPVKLVVSDAACDPQQAVNAAAKLVARGVVAVVGGYCSGAALPAIDVYADGNVPFIISGANSTKLITANQGSAFMINGTAYDQVKLAINYFENQGYETLAIVNQGDAYSQNLAKLTRDRWEDAGHEVATFVTTGAHQVDFSALVTRIRSDNPDAVFWTAYYAHGAKLIRQLRRGGYQGDIIVGDGNTTSKIFKLAGRAAEGIVGFSAPVVKFLPRAEKFFKKFKGKYGSIPGPYAVLTYDGVKLLADAIERAGSTDPGAIVQTLAKTKSFNGLAGDISFTDEHTLAKSNFIVVKGKGGKWVPVKK